ncbi:VPS9 domain-containing protein 1 [Sphaeramia orbicularis]|uniref:VPS9 domain-containing protein 1 n=1 Tax=Sphaeramia orbicularis TaxID=375764 RepID=UPI0011815C31|nr:VPS9 domain-containing protein 1 [Sphaeramia orbicularis]XP_029992079.1 VPS9 domain-containing protein 1 [Sphaeramia orbicularis]
MAVADSGVKPLQNAMKMAKVAIQLDAGNKHKEAYCEYLRTISFISHVLLEAAESQNEKDVEVPEVEVGVGRMLRLAEQCLERAKSFIGKSSAPSDPSLSTSAPCPIPASSSGQSQHEPTVPPPTTAAAAYTGSPSVSPVDTRPDVSSPTNRHRRGGSDGGGVEHSPFVPPEVFQRLQTAESHDQSKKELTPIEEASRLNQKLKASYEARVARLSPGQAYQKTSLTLSLQRQMMENLIIAKARQDALQRKMEERRLRLQEEANRRFAASGAMTAEDQEQRILYTNVLEYEQDHDWPKQWKSNLKRNPDNVTLVSELVSYLLSQSDHPVVKLLRKHQYRVYNKLYPIVSKGPPPSPAGTPRPSRSTRDLLQPDAQRTSMWTGSGVVCSQSFTDSSLSPSLSHHLNTDDEGEEGVEPNMHTAVDRENSFEDLEHFLTQLDWAPPLHAGFGSEPTPDPDAEVDPEPDLGEDQIQELEMRALKEHLKGVVKDVHIAIDQLLSLCLLSFECLNTSTSKDLCLAIIEEAFFTPLWSPLVALFRTVHRDKEQAFELSMKLYRDASPGDVGVPLKLFPPDPDALQGSYPYQSAVQELRLLLKDTCPQRKLDCIVRTLRLICACAEDYRCLHEAESTPKTAAIGADDLLPILSFVALRCQCPQLVSECAALEEFIHEGYLIGEEGYCLTSMQSALAYVESLHTGRAHPHADRVI